MDNRSEVLEFLVSRRAHITPDQTGLPAYGGNRRVPGLRRDEVALLAGVSIDYYTRLERGNLSGVSESVLDGLATALQLDEAERGYLCNLAHASNATPNKRRPPVQRVRSSVQQTLDAISGAPAYVRNGRRDVLAANRLGYALYSEMYADPMRPWPGSSSSAHGPGRSSLTGTERPATPWRHCAPKPAGIRTTAICRT